MPRKGVTLDQVAETMAEIEANGQKATVRLVREQLGTGSASTISKHMSYLRSQTEANLDGIPVMPETFELHLKSLFQEVWKASHVEASKKSLKYREDLYNSSFEFGAIKDTLSELSVKAAELEDYFHDAAVSTKENN